MKQIKKTRQIKAYKLPIEIEQEGDYFIATCPQWPDCYAQGNSIDEATAEIIAVASSLIELYQEEEIPIPLHKNTRSTVGVKTKVSFNVPIFVSA